MPVTSNGVRNDNDKGPMQNMQPQWFPRKHLLQPQTILGWGYE